MTIYTYDRDSLLPHTKKQRILTLKQDFSLTHNSQGTVLVCKNKWIGFVQSTPFKKPSAIYSPEHFNEFLTLVLDEYPHLFLGSVNGWYFDSNQRNNTTCFRHEWGTGRYTIPTSQLDYPWHPSYWRTAFKAIVNLDSHFNQSIQGAIKHSQKVSKSLLSTYPLPKNG